MAITYRHTVTHRVVRLLEPHDRPVRRQRQRARAIQRMDASTEWERAERKPRAVGGLVRDPGPRLVGEDFCVVPPAPTADPDPPFDPAGRTVAEVNAHLATAEAGERSRVLAAEAAGKARRGIVNGPHAT